MRWFGCFIFILFFLTTSAQQEKRKFRFTLGKPGRYVLFPLVVKSPEYEWGFGVGGTVYFKIRKDSATRTSSIKGVTFYTLRKQIVFATESNIYFPNEDYILHTIFTASHFPDKFWGLGNDTENSAVEDYSITQYDIFPQLLRKIYSHIYSGIGYEFQHVFNFAYNMDGQSLFDQEDIVGRYGGKISGVGLILTWDNRNNAFSPSKGFYIQYYVGGYDQWLGSDFNFTMHNVDIRKYIQLSRDRVLAFQFNLIATTGTVPIRNLANIGSNSFMRGYYEGRYTDKALIAFQTEFRTPLFGRFGGVLFSGIGRVASNVSRVFQISNMKPCVGAGLRFAINQKEKLNLRLDAGFGKQAHGTYLNMGEAF